MPDDFKLDRHDFDDCFAGAPDPVPVTADLARGRAGLRRRRAIVGGSVAAAIAVVLVAVPLVNSRATGPVFDPAASPSARVTDCVPATIKITEAITDPARRPIVDATDLPAVENGKRVLLHAVAANGERLIEIGRDELTAGGLGQLYIEDPKTGGRTPIPRTNDGPASPGMGSAVSVGALDQGFAAWIETEDSAWSIKTFDRSTGEVSTVVDSTKPSEATYQHVPDNYPDQVTLRDGSLFWTESLIDPRRPDELKVNIYQRELGGSSPTRIAVAGGRDPVITDGWLYYWDFGDQAEGYAVLRRPLGGGRPETVHADPTRIAQELSAFGDVVAWIEGDAMVVYRGSTRIARVIAPEGGRIDSVEAGDGAIAIKVGGQDRDQELLLDLRQGCSLHRLDAQTGGQAMMTGSTVAWMVDDPKSDRPGWTIGRLR